MHPVDLLEQRLLGKLSPYGRRRSSAATCGDEKTLAAVQPSSDRSLSSACTFVIVDLVVTKTDLGRSAWMIDDEIIQLREWGTERTYALPSGPAAELTIGSAETCSLQLNDPSGRLSRRHARIAREVVQWSAHDLDSKNGMRLDGLRRSKALLEPGFELGLGGITLVAESPRLIALRGFLARILGWSAEGLVATDLALRSVRLATTRRATLSLLGDGDLVVIARGLHRYSLGDDRPFVVCERRGRGNNGAPGTNYASGMAALHAAAGGTVCVLSHRLPRDFAELTSAIRDPGTHVQLLSVGNRPSDRNAIVVAPIEMPPLAARTEEIDRIIHEYASDAAAKLGVANRFTSADHDWARRHSASSLQEIEKGTLRLLALREAGSVARAAELIGMAHSSLGEWIGRRRIP